MKTVYVFKTSVNGIREVRRLKPHLDALINGDGKWNFDLEDCDRILRVEGHAKIGMAIVALMCSKNHTCQELR